MPEQTPARTRCDINQLATSIVDAATNEAAPELTDDTKTLLAAIALREEVSGCR